MIEKTQRFEFLSLSKRGHLLTNICQSLIYSAPVINLPIFLLACQHNVPKKNPTKNAILLVAAGLRYLDE